MDLGKISSFFLGIELIADTIIAGASHIGSKVSIHWIPLKNGAITASGFIN